VLVHQSEKSSPGDVDHRRDEDQEVDRGPRAHKRCREAAQRVPHDHNVAAVTQRVDDGVGVLSPASQAVFDGEVDGHCAVPTVAKFSRDQMPVPAAATTTVDKCERGHNFTLATCLPSVGIPSFSLSPSTGHPDHLWLSPPMTVERPGIVGRPRDRQVRQGKPMGFE
jgi:hypothetical protein